MSFNWRPTLVIMVKMVMMITTIITKDIARIAKLPYLKSELFFCRVGRSGRLVR